MKEIPKNVDPRRAAILSSGGFKTLNKIPKTNSNRTSRGRTPTSVGVRPRPGSGSRAATSFHKGKREGFCKILERGDRGGISENSFVFSSVRCSNSRSARRPFKFRTAPLFDSLLQGEQKIVRVTKKRTGKSAKTTRSLYLNYFSAKSSDDPRRPRKSAKTTRSLYLNRKNTCRPDPLQSHTQGLFD